VSGFALRLASRARGGGGTIARPRAALRLQAQDGVSDEALPQASDDAPAAATTARPAGDRRPAR
jgi:hypothetical protein